ncbi:hypothetical protein ACFVT5_41090 [Streptomyces sp. NPDC058001]|uniref:hypothetical protein n=1 Tax=Streptomyces sp. NPDC058001 TaxID=3346300 RepID=UPI0036E929FD
MSTFEKGDRVTVVAADPEYAATIGESGVVLDDGSLSGGLIAVKGIYSRGKELLLGYPAYTADQLRKV